MESINLLGNAPIQTDDSKKASEMASGLEAADNKKKMRVAKEFETILVGQLMNQMKETIGESDFLEDGSSKQIKDMFWSFLSDDIGKNGGFGLWENIYKSMSPEKVDQQIGNGIGNTENTNIKFDQIA